MKVKIEIDSALEETEIIIRCNRLDDSLINLQNSIMEQGGIQCISLCKGETAYYVPIKEIYFFETEGREIRAHTAGKIFACSYKLYELEETLPGNFMRVSKSAIVNLDKIYSITRNLTASSIVEFAGSNKKAAVSRGYYKMLTERLNARKIGY